MDVKILGHNRSFIVELCGRGVQKNKTKCKGVDGNIKVRIGTWKCGFNCKM